MTLQTAYENWLKNGQEVETLDQAMFILSNEITKRPLLEQYSSESVHEQEIGRICSLRESLTEFTMQEYGESLEEFKCKDIGFGFLEAYREFLQAKESHDEKFSQEDYHLETIGNIFYLSKKHKIADWDLDVFLTYEGHTLHFS